MKSLVRNGTIMLALLAGIGAAGAASVRSAGFDGLTDAQRQQIWQGVSKQATNESLPAGFEAELRRWAVAAMLIHVALNGAGVVQGHVSGRDRF